MTTVAMAIAALLAAAQAAPVPQAVRADMAPTMPLTEADGPNREALSAAAAQTDRIAADKERDARNLAAYAKAQAEYERSVDAYRAEKAAVARRAAEQDEAYRQRLAAWQAQAARPVRSSPPPASGIAAPPPRHCTMQQPTGSMIPVRACD